MKTYNGPTEGDCDVQMFVELWSSTALGFGGIGGALNDLCIYCNH